MLIHAPHAHVRGAPLRQPQDVGALIHALHAYVRGARLRQPQGVDALEGLRLQRAQLVGHLDEVHMHGGEQRGAAGHHGERGEHLAREGAAAGAELDVRDPRRRAQDVMIVLQHPRRHHLHVLTPSRSVTGRGGRKERVLLSGSRPGSQEPESMEDCGVMAPRDEEHDLSGLM